MMKGVDVYRGDGTIDWPLAYRQGKCRFAIIKASEGDFSDSAYQRNTRAARKAGLYVGAYHFFRPTGDAVRQAKRFLATLENPHNQLPPTLDVEDIGNMSRAAYTQSVVAWLRFVEAALGVRPMIYLNRDYAGSKLLSTVAMQRKHRVRQEVDFSRYPLWLAEWRSGSKWPGAVPGWPQGPTIWQNSAYATVPGLPNIGGVDTDLFRGGVPEMEALLMRVGGAK